VGRGFQRPYSLTGALIDRLAHKAHVLDISREKGGRFEETLAWLGRAGKNPKTQTRKRYDIPNRYNKIANLFVFSGLLGLRLG